MEFIPGSIELDDSPVILDVWSSLEKSVLLNQFAGVCYYRLPPLGVAEPSQRPNFVIISEGFGVLLIEVVSERVDDFLEDDFWNLSNGETIPSRDILLDNFKNEVVNRFSKEKSLYNRQKREATLPIQSLLIFTENSIDSVKNVEFFADTVTFQKAMNEGLEQTLSKLVVESRPPQPLIDKAISTLESTDVYNKLRTRPTMKVLDKKNDYVEKALEVTFQLDRTQRKIAMQLPPGPQRVRGLAGTGKTVILSMKAALTHVSQPVFKILFLFNTRSMYKQIREKISTYYIREAQREPNWNNVDVLHAWGGKEQEGLYSKICKLYNLTPKTFRDVGNFSDPLEAIYSDLLTTLKQFPKVEPIYDMVLIDEAQDFSPALFEAVYLFTKHPKRIIWAYDEFQSLSELKIREPEELFGKGADGTPNIANTSLQGQYSGRIDKDFVLPNSYRNPRLTLMAAHGLALGIYRREGIIDVLEDRQDWRALGYEVTTPPEKGTYAPGEHLVIERPESYSRNVLERLLKENGEDEQRLVTIEAFESRKSELEYVVREIEDLVNFQGADPSQIIVIALDQSSAGTQFNLLRSLLMQRNIPSITPGFVESAGEFQWEGHVTLTTPYRAKGNESHFVFVLNIEKVPSDYTFRSRNALFVSITRALGWSYITGVGEKVAELEEEVRKISGDYPEFKFVFPSIEELSRRRALLSKNDKRVLSQQENLEEILSENPDLLIERLSGDPALLTRLSSDPVLVAKLREALRHKPEL